MILSLAYIFLLGLILAKICTALHLPRLVGFLLTGMILGPSFLNVLDPSLLLISNDLRKLALVIILIKAGLSLDLSDLKKVGRPALLMSFVPASFEVLGYAVLAPVFFSLSMSEAALMGSVMAAVSPAVVVPGMVRLMERKKGTKKGIPQMILAGASLDDIFVMVLFTSFLSQNLSGTFSMKVFFNVPCSILLGIVVGALVGKAAAWLFEWEYRHGKTIRNSMKVIVILALSFLLTGLETPIQVFVPYSGYLAVLSFAAVLKLDSTVPVTKRLGEKFGKVWLFAEVLLFVLVGAAVSVSYSLQAGPMVLLLIISALVFRSIGVWLCVIKTNLDHKERLFTVFAYLPKATVQAAIGSIALAEGLPCGNLILTVAVCGILLTAPIGAFLIDHYGEKFLAKEE